MHAYSGGYPNELIIIPNPDDRTCCNNLEGNTYLEVDTGPEMFSPVFFFGPSMPGGWEVQ